eukprot:1792025-Rhodomonas_salina.2
MARWQVPAVDRRHFDSGACRGGAGDGELHGQPDHLGGGCDGGVFAGLRHRVDHPHYCLLRDRRQSRLLRRALPVTGGRAAGAVQEDRDRRHCAGGRDPRREAVHDVAAAPLRARDQRGHDWAGRAGAGAAAAHLLLDAALADHSLERRHRAHRRRGGARGRPVGSQGRDE